MASSAGPDVAATPLPIAASAAALIAAGAAQSPILSFSRPQHENKLPEATLCLVFSFLHAHNLLRAACVSSRWHAASHTDALWRELSRRTIGCYHPNPEKDDAWEAWIEACAQAGRVVSSRPHPRACECEHVCKARRGGGGEEQEGETGAAAAQLDLALQLSDHTSSDQASDPDVSLSIARSRVLERSRIARATAVAARSDAVRIRSATVAAFRRAATACSSYRIAFRSSLPWLRPHGVYALRHEYVRKGVHDAFHPLPGILRCVYHRNFWFQPDGRLGYTMMPGESPDGVREMRKPKSSHVRPGWYVMEGNVVKAEVFGHRNIVTRWTMRVESHADGHCNRLIVEELLLYEGGADEGAVTPMTQLEGEMFVYAPVRAWA